MRLTDPLTKTEGNVPVAIFSLGEQRMFLPISEGYQDMLRRVTEDFDLEEDVVLSLRTSSIDACRGREVIIPESAYVYLWKYLEEVDVGIVEGNQGGRRQRKRAQEKRRAISPIAQEYASSVLNDIETEDFQADLSTVIYEEAPLDEERFRTPIPDGAGRGIAGSSKVPDVTGGNVGHSQKSNNVDDDDHSIDQIIDELFEFTQEKAPPKTADPEPITEPKDGGGEGKSNSEKRFKPTVALLPKFNKEIGSPVTVKKEILAEPVNEETKVKKTNILAPQPDPRFEITIISPQNETAQFKTRGGHPVRKVLAAACRTFGIKYEQARLILSVSTEEGGEIQTDEFDCPPGETMSQCGVDGSAKLFVRVEPAPDDEIYEED